MINEPTLNMQRFKSIKTVLAGEITEVFPGGCYVKNLDGTATFRSFPVNMTIRYVPKVGDFWVIYQDGYQAISPAAVFTSGHITME